MADIINLPGVEAPAAPFRISPEAGTRYLDEISQTFTSWYQSRGEDSVQHQRRRAIEFYGGGKNLGRLIGELMLIDRQIQLTVGDIPIQGVRFGRGPIDTLDIRFKDLDAESTLAFMGTKRMSGYRRGRLYTLPPEPYEFYQQPEHFVGNHRAMVPVSILAQTLNQGGKLDVIPWPAKLHAVPDLAPQPLE